MTAQESFRRAMADLQKTRRLEREGKRPVSSHTVARKVARLESAAQRLLKVCS